MLSFCRQQRQDIALHTKFASNAPNENVGLPAGSDVVAVFA